MGKDHALAAELWKTGRYEARLLAALVDDPSQVTKGQMNAWAAAFDSWAVTDTVCFHLFSRVPAAWEKARQWSASPREFVKRGGFALMASLVLRDKASPDARFVALLPLIEKGSRDERNLVKKGVNWALRTVGKRSPKVHAAALATAGRLAASNDLASRWVGRDALRELASAKVRARVARRAQ
jgi:3-methyladenine DNA glycosylase AlkD